MHKIKLVFRVFGKAFSGKPVLFLEISNPRALANSI
jgi:hypothetical protein